MKLGSLFSGYGGLDLAVKEVLGAEAIWHVEYEHAASRVLAHHYPHVPNYGDVKLINWADIPPVDILTGGYPCQPFSTAGLRKGANDDRHLWPHFAKAIAALRPGMAILENVVNHLRIGFNDVLRDITQMGYDVRWGVVRASDAGAPHRRARIFAIATDPNNPIRLRRIQPGLGAWSNPGGRDETHSALQWGDFGPAVRHWERILNRPAPIPYRVVTPGKPSLEAPWVEWMMGLPEGWVTGAPISQHEALKMLGNGVVPQQAALALRLLLDL